MEGLCIQARPFDQGWRILKCVVIRVKLIAYEVSELQPSSWLKMAIGLLAKARNISHRSCKGAAMDEFERPREVPVGFEVVDLEIAIRRDPLFY